MVLNGFIIKKTLLFIFLYVYVCVSVYGYMYICVGSQGSQKRALAPLKLEVQAIVSHLVWMLRTELGFSARGVFLNTELSLQPCLVGLLFYYLVISLSK